VKILLADDHGLFRDSMATWLQQYPVPLTIQLASDWTSLTAQLAPDLSLIMLDLAMPGMSGAASISRLTKRLANVPILIVSANDDPNTIKACLHFGASGYLTKASDGCEIIKALSTVLKGDTYQPSIMTKQNYPISNQSFSDKQLELLAHLAEGLSNKDIASQMNLAEGTVKQYVSHLLTLLDVDNRTQAGNKAKTLLGF
jgi:DNA-binding NarL/FixJ family response regulator